MILKESALKGLKIGAPYTGVSRRTTMAACPEHEFIETNLFVEFRTEPYEWPPSKLLPVQMCVVCGVLRMSPQNQTKVA